MPGVIDAEKLYEREIQRLQSELGNLESEIHKAEARRDQVKDEVDRLQGEVQKKKNELADLGVQIKNDEEAFKKSRANSVAAMEKREAESVERITKSEKALQEAKDTEARAKTARNSLVGLSEDILKTYNKFKVTVDSLEGSVVKELESYQVLKDPKAEIPVSK